MENKSKVTKKIQPVFPRLKEQDVHLPQDLSYYKDKKFFDLFEIDIDDLSTWFEGFRVESIELFVDSIINSSDQTKLIVESQVHKSQNFGAVMKDA